MRRWPFFLSLVLAACVSEPNPPADEAQPSAGFFWSFGYSASVLPLTEVRAINSAGAVVGKISSQGVYYAQGVATNLALLSTVTSVTPIDLTDNGKIIARGNGPQGPKALFYVSPSASPIDVLAPRWAEPEAINNAEVVVGRYGAPRRSWGGFRWSATTGLVDVTPAGYDLAWPTDISETGYAIGWIQLGNAVYNARWSPSNVIKVLPSGFSAYQAANDGNVMGRRTTFGASIWTPYGFFALGPDPTRLGVNKISPNGRLVGTYTDQATGRYRAWTSLSSGPTYLPLPTGYLAAQAISVNGCGTIIGYGWDSSNVRRAVMWSKFGCDTGGIVIAQ